MVWDSSESGNRKIRLYFPIKFDRIGLEKNPIVKHVLPVGSSIRGIFRAFFRVPEKTKWKQHKTIKPASNSQTSLTTKMADIWMWPMTIYNCQWLWSSKLRSCPTRLPLIAVLVSGGDSTIIAINPSHSSLIASFVTITSDQTGQILAIAQTRRTTSCGGRL